MNADAMNWMSVKEAADLLGYDESLICRYCRQGKLKARRIGKRTWLIERGSATSFTPQPVGRPRNER